MTAQSQLNSFIDRFTPEIAALAKAALAKMTARFPAAIQLVYDNYNALVIGFGPTERPSEAVFSIVLYPRWVTLFFLDGVDLPDPQNLLKGGGKHVRHIVLESAAMLDQPAVRALMKHAVKAAEKKFDSNGSGRLIIRSISPKQRSRRPGEKGSK